MKAYVYLVFGFIILTCTFGAINEASIIYDQEKIREQLAKIPDYKAGVTYNRKEVHKIKESPTLAAMQVGTPYQIAGKTYVPHYDPNYNKVGFVSWYGPGFYGKKTASGEIYDGKQLTAASPTLPLNSKVTVTNLENGKKVVVTINDRGPFVAGRLIDLSPTAAKKIDMLNAGTVKARVTVQKRKLS